MFVKDSGTVFSIPTPPKKKTGKFKFNPDNLNSGRLKNAGLRAPLTREVPHLGIPSLPWFAHHPRYVGKEDGSVEPQKIHTVVISTQHAEPSKAVRTKAKMGKMERVGVIFL